MRMGWLQCGLRSSASWRSDYASFERLFTRPANVLVLDEPTNDLDLETLELLEATLVEWPGTLLLVSHDRRFLDNVVTSTLVFEGDGKVQEHVGGYLDWVRHAASTEADRDGSTRARAAPTAAAEGSRPARSAAGADAETSGPPRRRRRSFKEEREYEALPGRIAALEDEQRALHATVADPAFYKEGAGVIKRTLARIEAIDGELLDLLARWDELDSVSG